MQRRISSAFTEFYKVYGILCLAIFFAFFGFRFFYLPDLPVFLFFSLIIFINIINAFDFWRMKEVEMTDAGLLISRRIFFNQETIFVPYENIEKVKSKLWWFGNEKRISIKFAGVTDFGKEIIFIGRGFRRATQAEIVAELSRTIIRNKTSGKINAALRELEN